MFGWVLVWGSEKQRTRISLKYLKENTMGVGARSQHFAMFYRVTGQLKFVSVSMDHSPGATSYLSIVN